MGIKIQDSTSFDVGIRVCGLNPNDRDDDRIYVIIPKNTPYPCESSVTKQTARDGQTIFKIIILQREYDTEHAEFCQELAKMQISGIPSGPAGSEKFTCTLKID